MTINNMPDWTNGYVANIDYTYGYYTELNPQRLRLAFLNAGLAFPASGSACELGFGQGLSVDVHAAASLTSWYGTDFNPAQAGFAQELVQQSGASAQMFDQGFAEFCVREYLPEFNYISLQGYMAFGRFLDPNTRSKKSDLIGLPGHRLCTNPVFKL